MAYFAMVKEVTGLFVYMSLLEMFYFWLLLMVCVWRATAQYPYMGTPLYPYMDTPLHPNMDTIRQSIPLEWRNIINKERIKENNTEQKLQINLCGALKPIKKISCKDSYWHIINKAEHEPTAKIKWSDIYN